MSLDYLRTEVPKAITQLLDGVEHVARIVRAMKEFSHPGPVEKAPVDINRAIESTALVSRNEWKYVAELITDFDPELPRVRHFRTQGFGRQTHSAVSEYAHRHRSSSLLPTRTIHDPSESAGCDQPYLVRLSSTITPPVLSGATKSGRPDVGDCPCRFCIRI